GAPANGKLGRGAGAADTESPQGADARWRQARHAARTTRTAEGCRHYRAPGQGEPVRSEAAGLASARDSQRDAAEPRARGPAGRLRLARLSPTCVRDGVRPVRLAGSRLRLGGTAGRG